MKKLIVLVVVALCWMSFGSLYSEKRKVDLSQFLKDFEEMAVKGMEDEKLPGMAIGIVKGEEVIYLKGFGVKKEGEAGKVDVDTVFQLASCSKPVTGTVVAAAVSHGFLKFDDKIVWYVPNFKMKDGWVTREFMVKDALGHRSGLRQFSADDLELIGYSLDEIIERFQYLEPVSSFRSEYAYQNIVITIGGLAAAKAAKKDFDVLAKEVLFEPLDMKNSGYYFDDYDKAQNKSYGHVKDERGRWVARYVRHPDVQFGGGGVSSSAHDMSNWLIMYLNDGRYKEKQVIGEKEMKEVHTPQIFSGELEGVTNFYGMGIVIGFDNMGGDRFFKHSGAFSIGVRSMIYMLPEEKLGIVVLSNAFPSGLPEGLCYGASVLYRTGNKAEAMAAYKKYSKGMVMALEGLLESPVKKDVGKEAGATLPLEKYIGIYKSDYYDLLEIKKSGDELEGFIGKHRVKLAIKPYEGNVFSFKYKGIDGDETLGLLTFEVGGGDVIGAKLTGFEGGAFKKGT